MARVGFRLPRADRVRVDIFDVRGRLMRNLVDREYEPGEWEARWDGSDDSGRSLPPGVYFTRVRFMRTSFDEGAKLLILH